MTALVAQPWWFQAAVAAIICGVSVAVWWFLVQMQGRSAGHDWKTEVWPEIRKSPVAVALYRCGVYGSLAYIVAEGFSRFIG